MWWKNYKKKKKIVDTTFNCREYLNLAKDEIDDDDIISSDYAISLDNTFSMMILMFWRKI